MTSKKSDNDNIKEKYEVLTNFSWYYPFLPNFEDEYFIIS